MPARARVSAEFGQAVRDAISSRSQSEVALLAQISVGYVNRMARGSVPSREIILRLADALDAPVEPLLSAAGYAVEEAPVHLNLTHLRPAPLEHSPAIARSEEMPSHREDSRTSSRDNEALGSDAASGYYREIWDRYIKPLFPDAEIPSGAGLPVTRGAIRARVLRILQELVEDEEG